MECGYICGCEEISRCNVFDGCGVCVNVCIVESIYMKGGNTQPAEFHFVSFYFQI